MTIDSKIKNHVDLLDVFKKIRWIQGLLVLNYYSTFLKN